MLKSGGCAQIEKLSKQILNLTKFWLFHYHFEELLYWKGAVLLVSNVIQSRWLVLKKNFSKVLLYTCDRAKTFTTPLHSLSMQRRISLKQKSWINVKVTWQELNFHCVDKEHFKAHKCFVPGKIFYFLSPYIYIPTSRLPLQPYCYSSGRKNNRPPSRRCHNLRQKQVKHTLRDN